MRYGLVSSKAVARVRPRPPDDGTGLPPPGAVSAGHINENQTPRRGSGFTDPQRDYGPSDLGHIDQKINKRNWNTN